MGWPGIILFIFYVFVKLFAIKLYKVGSGNQWLYPCSIVAASDKRKQTWVRTQQLYHISYLVLSEMEPTLCTIERWLYRQFYKPSFCVLVTVLRGPISRHRSTAAGQPRLVMVAMVLWSALSLQPPSNQSITRLTLSRVHSTWDRLIKTGKKLFYNRCAEWG